MDYMYYKGYTGIIKYSEADGCFVGKVLGMNDDLILYEGENIDELRADFEAGIESYFESCEEMGIEPRKPTTHLNASDNKRSKIIHNVTAKTKERLVIA
jgi:predicted HicB family RNase H-like nuclease